MKRPATTVYDRLHFLRSAAITVAVAKVGVIGSVNAQSRNAQSANLPAIESGTNASSDRRHY